MGRLRRPKGATSDSFPGYTDIAEIGIGSLATVYSAREIGTDRPVALKLLNVRDASPRAIESFERESIALGAVSSHPNIVTLYRSFRAPDDRPVHVLELCRGAIWDRAAGRGLPVADVVSMGVKIAGALETAHRAEILHRDVKPQNILITEFGEPALADFGVAMLQASTQTTAGLFDFTTLHAAPELLEGGAASAATDVYELASTIYQLIAGRSAFRAAEGESPASVILRILRDPVQPLVSAHAPAQLSDLLIRAMSKEKDERPASASEFAAELVAIESAERWSRTRFLVGSPQPAAAREPIAQPVPAPTRPRPLTTVDRFRPVRIDEDAADAVADLDEDAVASATPRPLPTPRAVSPTAASTTGETVVYPIPPAAGLSAAAGPAVPRWGLRVPSPAPRTATPPATRPATRPKPSPTPNPTPVAFGTAPDFDPRSLRRRVTIRAGRSTLTVDEARLVLRRWWRRHEVAWSDVRGFEARHDQATGAHGVESPGRLVALTSTGPLDLPATKRPNAELRELHALLDAYRRRAEQLIGHG